MMVLSALVWTLLLAPVTAFVAGQRGHPVMTWYVLGLILGPFGVFAFLLPKRRHEPEVRLS